MTENRIQRRHLAPLLLGVAMLPGCLTRMLWEEGLDTTELMRADAVCHVHSVRGDFLAGAASTDAVTARASAVGAIEVEFSVRREKHTPTEVEAFTPGNPGHLRLRPSPTEENWFALPGAAIFEPRMWEFGVFRGSYFTTRDSSVPLAFYGDLQPAQVGELRKQAEAPSAWRSLPPMAKDKNPHPLLDRAMTSLEARDWIRLIEGKNGFTERDSVPLAWLDKGGRVASAKEVQDLMVTADVDPRAAERLAEYTLLGRLEGAWGDPIFVRIPVPILVQGERLRMTRTGGRILWQRSQVWRGELVAGKDRLKPPRTGIDGSDRVALHAVRTRPVKAMPLLSNQFVYAYAEESDGDSVLLTLAKYLLTPPAVLLDFAAQTSVFYADLVRWMADGKNQKWSGPIGGERK